MALRIIDLVESDTTHIDEVADFVYRCFQKYAPTWVPDITACREEIKKSFDADRRSRLLLDDRDQPIGWIGAITDANLWEIHPIAVSPSAQRNGYGKLLVEDVVTLAREAGAVSVWAGTSDETNSTSFSKLDLYNDPSVAFQNIAAPSDHPVRFWLTTGFSLVGVMPDEEGLGKPGIHFARRIV
jgi:aminoglycoside 6'-N-acetyltransferase I